MVSNQEGNYKGPIGSGPYWKLLGMKVETLQPGYARLAMPIKPDLLQSQGQVHGGAISSIVDASVAAAVAGTLAPDERATTVEMKLNYLAPIKEGEVIAIGKLIKRGKTLAIGTSEVTDEAGKIISYGMVTYMIMKRTPIE